MPTTESTYLVQLQEKREVFSLPDVVAQQLLKLLAKIKLESAIPHQYQQRVQTPQEKWVTISNYGILDNLNQSQAEDRADMIAGSRIHNIEGTDPSRKTELKKISLTHGWLVNKFVIKKNN